MKIPPVPESETAMIRMAKVLLDEKYGGNYQKVDIRHHMTELLAHFCYDDNRPLIGNDLRVVRGITRLVLKRLGEI